MHLESHADSIIAFMVLAKRLVLEVGAGFDLTNMQVLTLLYIQNDNPQPMSSLCEIFGCDASNMTGIIHGLEQKKIVSRRARPGDRRIKDVCLEPLGIRIQQAAATALADRNNAMFSQLTNEQYETFTRLLQIMMA